ncbi:MAG TPA: efflux RND transporter permease subunit [Spongiibacteraceae bacterium]|jgi:multidrug efflux pump subunit AcrB|nr:efflux RND transporter permease subunit [Spongiibacteraceae bacterium]
MSGGGFERLLANPRVVVLALALILVAGFNAISTLPRLEDPPIVNRNAIVIAQFPGASAERVEALVAEPIERILREIPEIKHINATARAGIGAVSIELQDAVRPAQVEALWTEARDKLRQVDLPAGVAEPVLDTERGHAFTWIAALRWRGDNPDLLQSGRYARELASRLNNLGGTDIVRVYGAPAEEIVVALDPARTAALGLDVAQIAQRIGETDAKVAAGQIHNAEHRVTLEVRGALEELERVRRIPLRTDPRGVALQLGDIASVRRGEHLPPADYAIVDGERAVVVAVRMQSNYRGDEWTARLRQAVAELQAQWPQEIELEELFVQERYTDARLSGLVVNVLQGFTLIVVVLWLTLGLRAALLVALSLPVTVCFALALMRIIDLPIHQVSVIGLMVALGIMVDNAIVMADTVMRFRREGVPGLAAALRAVRHLWLPLLGSTLTTILAFMPIALMPGPSGEFVGGIALTVSFALAGSWLISLFIVAPLAGRWLSADHRSGLHWPRLTAMFARNLNWTLRHPWQVMAIITLLPAAGFVAGGWLPEQFFPPSDRDMINLELYLPASASIDATRRATDELSAALAEYPEITALHWFIGRSAPPFYYNLMDRRDGSQFYAQAMLRATDYRAANALISRLQMQLNQAFPHYQIMVRRLEQGPPTSAPVELRLIGPDLDHLQALGDRLRGIALATPDVIHVRDALGESVPKLWLRADDVAGKLSGTGLTGLAADLERSLGGQRRGSILEGSEQLPVRVQMGAGQRTSVHALQVLPMALPGGTRPLMALADFELRPARAQITRRDGERVNTVEIYSRDTVLPAVVLARVRAALDREPFVLPPGYRLEIGGESEGRADAVARLMSSVNVIIVLLLVTVMLAFNSFRLTAIVFCVALQAAGLGMLSLALSGYPFGFNCIIALMGLVGLAVNAGIVILSEIRVSPGAMAGDLDVIQDCVTACTRHISSTTITTVVGLLPLIIAGGGLWPPFAVVMAGGTLLATVLSLFFVPAAFVVLRATPLPAWRQRLSADR